jgi:ATP-dependent Lon protease
MKKLSHKDARRREMTDATETMTLPMIPMVSMVVFPGRIATLQISIPENISLVEQLEEMNQEVVMGFCEPTAKGNITTQSISRVAVYCRLIERLRLPGDGFRITVQGIRRVEVLEVTLTEPFFEAEVAELEERTRDPFRVNVYVQKAINLYDRLANASPRYPKELTSLFKVNGSQPGTFADLMTASIEGEYAERHQVLQAVGIDRRLQRVLEMLRAALDRVKVAHEVEKRAKVDIEDSRREYYLRQQMKSIQKELGDGDLSKKDADEYEELLDQLDLPDMITKEARREIERLRHIQPSSSEFQVIKTYLERFFSLPWNTYSDERIELPKVQEELDDGHFGLEKVKKRILEFLAVRKLNPDHKGAILCFLGPPGVGKTSLGKAIATAIDRKFFRISVGGVRDEAEIRGHRRTYVGAMPGKILNGISRAGCMNPLLMLDEIDKIGNDHRGDPASALLEVLDPEQNDAFTDHYFNVPFDLSKVLFIVTANYIHDIPKPLLDRLEVISIEGYTETEKVEIAKRHLIPSVLKDHGLMDIPPKFDDEAVTDIVRYWTREAGVRNLKRCFEKLSRKTALERVEFPDKKTRRKKYRAPVFKPLNLAEYLGPQKYSHDEGVQADEIGVANGLAWTSTGGEVLLIEVLKMPGQGKLVITGKLGDVMKESVQAAYSFVRSRLGELGLEYEAIKKYDLHIHFPAGAVPKDGPSAGITVTLAIASSLSGFKV